jgi:hypothetical protein
LAVREIGQIKFDVDERRSPPDRMFVVPLNAKRILMLDA